ncbi:MAG: 4-hydroxythreonine-4-phosphate dehydrogenase PdxA, partial [Thioalkalispiraceae bacterium]
RLIITPGEPAGIGPDLILQYIHTSQPSLPLIVIADQTLLATRAKQLGIEVNIREYSDDLEFLSAASDTLYVKHVPLETPSQPGKLNPKNSRYVIRCLDLAVELCEQPNSALVTGPVHKGIINDAGIPFSGHTEYLAERAGIELPVMMLATEGLRVALATTHIPLARVSQQITRPLLTKVLSILHKDLVSKFAIAQPRITVCGLNPHAGESGHLGTEEIEIIEPVMEYLRKQGMQLTGPVPADTAFTRDKMQQADAYLAMYHDQGLPVLKHVGFGQAVNITLGLPFIRTSVDHGTALELAGTGKAEVTSLKLAMDSAQELINNMVKTYV